MASLKNAHKSFQRLHRERHQPDGRSHLGYLEKKKDYKARALDHQSKKNALKLLRKKALDKNPDEFHFHMINSQLVDGKHFEKKNPEEFTESQLKLMQSQDVNYVSYKRSVELKKVERLRANLHLMDVGDKPKNKHTFFTESKQAASSSAVAERFNTLPELLGRTYNMPNLDKMKQVKKLYTEADVDAMEQSAKERDRAYNELQRRVARAQQLKIILDKMTVKKEIMKSKGKGTVTKIKDGDATSAPVYKWAKERKR